MTQNFQALKSKPKQLFPCVKTHPLIYPLNPPLNSPLITLNPMRLLNQIKKRSPVVKPQLLLPGTKGLATLPLIIILSLIILAIGTSMMASGFIESLMSKAAIEVQESFYLSDSGIDDALLKIARDKKLGEDAPIIWHLLTSESTITVSGTTSTRVIDSKGIISGKHKNLKTDVNLNEYGQITVTDWEELTE